MARSVNAAASRMVNLYPEIVPEAGKEPAFLQRCPGMTLLATVGTGPVRGVWALGAFLYVVSGPSLYQVTSAYASTLIGTILGTGPVSMADNGTQIFIACNPQGYIYDVSTGTLSQISDPDFPGSVTVGYLDGYFIFNEPNSQKLWITDLLDGTSIDGLDFASAEGSPDNLVAVLSNFRELWAFGTNSIEVWYNSGALDFPLQRIQGAFNELGCAAAFSIAKMDNGVFWLGKDARGQGIVYRANGYQGERISTHAVEWHIQTYGNISDAIAYTYQQDGHSFYVLTFPSADKTWVFDVATGAWHERAGFVAGAFTRHRSNCQVSFNSEIIVGDYANGNLYAFDSTVYADNGATQRWLRSWRALPTGENNLKRSSHHNLQLDCETGVGLVEPAAGISEVLLLLENGDTLTTEAGVDIIVSSSTTSSAETSVMLRWSDDGGHTWSNEHWVGIGRIGEYGRRAIWRRLGMTMKLRDRVYELSGSDPVKIAIMGAELFASPTRA